jgi:hypothetical protein
MNQQIHIDHKLFLEIKRYLAAVDLYRAEHCEPTWRSESASWPTPHESVPLRVQHTPTAH